MIEETRANLNMSSHETLAELIRAAIRGARVNGDSATVSELIDILEYIDRRKILRVEMTVSTDELSDGAIRIVKTES